MIEGVFLSLVGGMPVGASIAVILGTFGVLMMIVGYLWGKSMS